MGDSLPDRPLPATGNATRRGEQPTSGVPCLVVQLVFAFLVLESISILALLDSIQREEDEFMGGIEDRQGGRGG
jgi:hypothetical protein